MSGKKIAQDLLEILVCPLCKGELTYNEAASEPLCQQSKLAYKIVDGIPVMLPDLARKIEN